MHQGVGVIGAGLVLLVGWVYGEVAGGEAAMTVSVGVTAGASDRERETGIAIRAEILAGVVDVFFAIGALVLVEES